MPEPIGRDQRYMPGLDGLRAVAVLAVVADHLGVSWAPGGLLGVGVFFTLSGYLITDLLLGQWEADGSLHLGNFWLRRARRLLPALFLMLAVVVIWVGLAAPAQMGPLRGDAGAAAVYVNNWWLIFHHVSYFARFGPPSPLGNLWSLAVEEQFYLVWPWLLWLGLLCVCGFGRGRHSRTTPRQRERRRWVLASVTLALAVASAVEMAVLYHPSFDPTRIYDGTDTRAFGLLFGAALAMVWPSRRLRADVTAGARRLVDAMGVVGLVTILVLVWQTNQYSAFLYRGGMVLLSLATVLVVVAATHPASRVGAALGWRPMRWIGVRSYGIYLWHYPIIVLTTPVVSRGVNLPRAGLQVLASVGIAALSWRFVESPIRHGAFGRFAARVRSAGWRREVVPARSVAASAGAVAVIGLCSAALAGAVPAFPAGTLAVVSSSTPEAGLSASGASVRTTVHMPTTTTTTRPSPPAGAARGTTTTTAPTSTTALASPTDPNATLRTSCTSVVHIGDSTSESLVSPNYLPDPSQRLQAQYARVGVSNVVLEIEGATSVVETIDNQPNAYEVAQGLVNQGYHGCWVIALGTNDTADVAVGSNVSLATRIQRMMSVIGSQPVLWVNVISLLDSGPYSEANMQAWDQALVQACPQYPNMRVFDWASVAQPSWFISDGIHYNSVGSADRAAAIANALALAFPAGSPATSSHHRGAPPTCVVR